MKLVRCGPPGEERPGVLDADGVARDLSGYVDDIGGALLSDAGLAQIGSHSIDALPTFADGVRFGPPVAPIGKIVCVGLNYAEHADETAMATSTEPVLFMKASSAASGPYDDVAPPRGATKLDWEIELGVVIGSHAVEIANEDAMAHVAGYLIINDVSERAWQLEREGQWFKGKSADTFAPLGPWLVTRDEIGDPHALSLYLDVNGVRRQEASTAQMIHRVPDLIAYVSRFMSLMPGDIIATGTPSGVGLGLNPPAYLKHGDVMELSIERLGVQRQRVVIKD